MTKQERAERFRRARIELNRNGSETLMKVYEATGVSGSTVHSYENPQYASSPSVENIEKLATHYGVNTAWLTGQSESWSLDEGMQKIAMGTGLTPRAVEKLRELTRDDLSRRCVNNILESEEFEAFVRNLVRISEVRKDSVLNEAAEYLPMMEAQQLENSSTKNERELISFYTWQMMRNVEKSISGMMEDYQRE